MSPVRAWSLGLALVAAVPASPAAQEAVSSPAEVLATAPVAVSSPGMAAINRWAMCGALGPSRVSFAFLPRAGIGKHSSRPAVPRSPLYVVDGRILADGESIRQLDPDRIERTDVISASDAIQRFGPRGGNGAVLITLKQPG